MFKFNSEAKYKIGATYNVKTIDFDNQEISVTTDKSFHAKVPALFNNYVLDPHKIIEVRGMWYSHPVQFYQNQLNFAVYCATTGCGISYNNHLSHPDPFTKSVYRFHVYYQIRRILSELQVPLPHEKSFNSMDNPINMRSYERIRNEFNISKNQDFRQKLDPNNGLGTFHTIHAKFMETMPLTLIKSIEQKHHNAWSTFILDNSKGFTQPGVERLNDSIRTYVWCILSSQSQTRTDIIGFDAQKQFLANLEDAINSPIDLPGSIKRYQDTLRYARSKVDYAVGYGLYMLPSDLQLQIGVKPNYNNEIVVASEKEKLGLNDDINNNQIGHFPLKGTKVQKIIPEKIVTSSNDKDEHNSQKIALSVGLISCGLLLLYFRKK